MAKEAHRKQLCVRYLVILLLSFLLLATFSNFSTFRIERQRAPPPSPQELHKENLPWWEADDCQCEAKTCQEISVANQYLLMYEVNGSCGYRAWAAGSGQRVLSFSLFGRNPEYWRGLEEILQQVEHFYPGWKVRLYTDPQHRKTDLCPLLRRHLSLLYLCDITNLPGQLGNLSNVHPMMWRVAPLGDPQVAAMMVRDTDSVIIDREAEAVQEWLASGKNFHVMRDHPQHTMPVMGGMWGARWDNDAAFARKLTSLRTKMFALAVGGAKYGRDQNILKTVLWPAMTGRVIAHDSYNCRRFKGSLPWPSQRRDKSFVANIRFRDRYKNSTIPKPCPVFCRPPNHRDWLYC